MSDDQNFNDYQNAARRALLVIATFTLCVLVLMAPFAVAALPAQEFDDLKLSDQYWDAAEAGQKGRQAELYDEIHLLGGHIDEDCGGCDWPNTINKYRLGVHRLGAFFTE
ncbi:MAG: hypothetical protein P1V97_32495 [Planctomycetota bacterium]|nr:hypothetical protein [Planctomycetota bacterium]